MNLDTDKLRWIHVFSGLSNATLNSIASVLEEHKVAADTLLFLEGEVCEKIYFILEGEVWIFRSALDGREQVLKRIIPGQMFNAVAPIKPGETNPASARTRTISTLLSINAGTYRRLLKTHSDFTYAILEDFSSRLIHFTHLVENLSLHSVRGRLARFLLDQAGFEQSSRHWTQDEIADQLGTVRDVTGRTLRAFVDEGLIKKQRNKIIILKRKDLEDISLT